MRKGYSSSDDRMDSAFVMAQTDWRPPTPQAPTKDGVPGQRVFGRLVRTKRAMRRSTAKSQGTVMAGKLWDRLMKEKERS